MKNFKFPKIPIEKSKFTIALILLVQSASFLIMSIVQWNKRRSLAGAFLAIAAISGTVGGILMAKSADKEKKRLTVIDSLCGDYLDEDMFTEGFDVPVEDEIDEAEFPF